MAVAQTRRLHFAKKLIDETSLPMNQIALASGFGCVRRFNAGIRQVYHRTPTQIRSLARQKVVETENQYIFRLQFRPPYYWKGMLAFLEARATPGVEAVEFGTYRRSIEFDDTYGYVEVSLDEQHDALIVRVQFSNPQALFFIIERVRAMFDLNADWGAVVRTLRADPALNRQVESNPGLRVPGCWNPFELTVRAILGQQITVRGATALSGRLTKSFGRQISESGILTHLFPTAKVLADATLDSIGLPRARAQTIVALSRAVVEERIRFDGIVDFDAFRASLCEIPGIGLWTANYVAMRALAEPDAFPSTDIGLMRAMRMSSARQLERRAEAWRPWRAYAAMYLWSMGPSSVSKERVIDQMSSAVQPSV